MLKKSYERRTRTKVIQVIKFLSTEALTDVVAYTRDTTEKSPPSVKDIYSLLKPTINIF